MDLVFYLIAFLTKIIFWIVLISVILSWLVAFQVVNTRNEAVRRIYNFFNDITERMYRPIRRVIPTIFGGVDIAPFIVLVILQIINITLAWAYHHLS